MAIDGAGNLYVTDYYKNQVYVIPQMGGYSDAWSLTWGRIRYPVLPWAWPWTATETYMSPILATATIYEEIPAGCSCLHSEHSTLGSRFSNPLGLAVDANGNLFVADNGNGAVKEILAAGGYATVNTLATDGLSAINGLAVDGNGNVYVANTGNQTVLELPAANGYATVNTLAGGFSNPYGVAVDGSGNVFVADAINTAITERGLRRCAEPRLRQRGRRLNQPRQPADGDGRERRQCRFDFPGCIHRQQPEHRSELHTQQQRDLGLPAGERWFFNVRHAGGRRILPVAHRLCANSGERSERLAGADG